MARWFVDRQAQQGIPSVSLRRILPDAQFVGCQDWEISGCTADSRRLDPGQIFVAVRGPRHDGHQFVGQALERGAAGVVVERHCPEAGRLQVIVSDSRTAHARLCHALAGDPAEQLNLIAVTGTCGRTMTSLFLRSIFEATGVRFGLVNALGWSDGVHTHSVGSGFLGAEGLATILAEMVERGCTGGAIEIPASALEHREIAGMTFDAAVVTDLGAVPGHESNELLARRRAKARLFRTHLERGTAVVNADDPHTAMLGASNLDARLVTFGIERPADVSATIERLDADGARFRLRGFDREARVTLRLTGPGHVSQALAAAACGWAHDLPVSAVVAGLEAVTRVPGHLDPVVEGQDFAVWVDRARTDSELAQALAALRATAAGKVICVIGAEGLRDRSERIALAFAAETGANRVVLTSDNPRTEDPNQILDDLLSGFRRPGRVMVEADRRRAIELALAEACPGDAVLIAGKGSRAFQIYADRVVPFDDKAIAASWLRQRRASACRSSA
jgi:UDP-N-acetylmuramoyl-L-alanyl-D-glutamate--2,6-diaminopimelate ligase